MGEPVADADPGVGECPEAALTAEPTPPDVASQRCHQGVPGAVVGPDLHPLDQKEAEAHLEALFGGLSGFVALAFRWLADGKLSGEDRAGERWQEMRYRWPQECHRLLEDVRIALARGPVDVYLCPLLRKDDRRVKENGGIGQVVWVDLDRDPHSGAQVEGLSPGGWAWAVESGTGGHLHLYVPLSRPEEASQIEAANRALKRILQGDDKWSNESLLRLAGTWNFKTRLPRPVTFHILPHGPGVLSAIQIITLGTRGTTETKPAPTTMPLTDQGSGRGHANHDFHLLSVRLIAVQVRVRRDRFGLVAARCIRTA